MPDIARVPAIKDALWDAANEAFYARLEAKKPEPDIADHPECLRTPCAKCARTRV